MKTLQEKIDSLREDIIEAIAERVKDMGGEASLSGLDYRMCPFGFYRMTKATVSPGTGYLYIHLHTCDSTGYAEDASSEPEEAENLPFDDLYDIAVLLEIL